MNQRNTNQPGTTHRREFLPNGVLAPIIAHRGASGDAPENTLAAIKLAYEHNAMCVEIDVSISSDGVPYVHHDDKLQRCTSGQGLLCEHTAEQLDQIDASKLMPQFSPEPLPRLSAVITLLDELGMGLNLEIKPRAGLETPTVEAICSELEKSWPERLPLVFSSFNQQSLHLARQCAPDIARALLVGGLPDNWEQLMEASACSNIHVSASAVSAQDATAVKQADFGLYAYTVNDREKASTLLQWGIDGVFTDYPKALSVLLVS
jgi:glycerophosphoryl diester phosphodiesterase